MTTDISVSRWDPSIGHGQEIIDEFEYDGGNSSSRLFERSRIKALAGKLTNFTLKLFNLGRATLKSFNDFSLLGLPDRVIPRSNKKSA